MQQKAACPLFKQAISAVKKQVDSGEYFKKKSQTDNKQSSTDHQFDDMSSGEQQRLKELGVDLSKTKKIAKQSMTNHKIELASWKHDKYRPDRQASTKPKTNLHRKNNQSFTIRFPICQQYNKIYQLVKSQKAFIQEINENCIKFTKEHAFNSCKKILKSEEIQFQDQTEKKQDVNGQAKNNGKESIFNRLK